MERKVILLVDDNNTHQYSLGRHLVDSGFEVLHADTGKVALDLAMTQKPDVVLLDINLPDISGFEICKELKSNPDTQKIPVIFHSATHDTASAKSQAFGLGAASFLSYPIHIEHLVSVLNGTLARAGSENAH